MITSIDTNVLLDILIPNEEFYDASANALQSSADDGSLVICDLVYAELCVHFENQRDCVTSLRVTTSTSRRSPVRPIFWRAACGGRIASKAASAQEF